MQIASKTRDKQLGNERVLKIKIRQINIFYEDPSQIYHHNQIVMGNN